ncbi:MAG: DUF2163 domain-containing protein [Xenococcus sp. (in: cyanobacteria)]
MSFTTYSRVVRLTLSDGTEYGMTDCDRNISIDGLVYKAKHAITPEAVEQDIKLSANSLKLQSIIDIDGIGVVDVLGGRLRNAKVVYAKVNTRSLPSSILDGVEILLSGLVGEIINTGTRYTLEIKSLTTLLNQGVTNVASPGCRWRFGSTAPGECFSDGSATRDITPYTLSGTIASVPNANNRKRFDYNGNPSYSLKWGKCEITSGNNKGLITTISEHEAGSSEIQLLNALPFALVQNDSVTIQAGCNKSRANCEQWGNFLNFGGIPSQKNEDSHYMPGTDKIIATPTE